MSAELRAQLEQLVTESLGQVATGVVRGLPLTLGISSVLFVERRHGGLKDAQCRGALERLIGGANSPGGSAG